MDAHAWVTSASPENPPQNFYCQTRDVAQARVETVRSELLTLGWGASTAAIIAAVLGELTSNAFDHNIGKWPDVPGCWFETMPDSNRFTAVIADRGQGVRSSLERVRPGIDDVEALRIAFTEHVTGRAPEKRGNGLKFVMNALKEFDTVAFTFHSGDAKLTFHAKSELSQADFEITGGQPSLRGVVIRLELQRL